MKPGDTEWDPAYSEYYERMKAAVRAQGSTVAADPENPAEPRYFFRKDQAIIHKADFDLLERTGVLDDFAPRAGTTYSRLPAAERPRGGRPTPGTPLPFRVLDVPEHAATRGDEDALVRRLRDLRREHKNLRISLNHMVAGVPHIGCPAGPPTPCEGPPAPDGADGRGVSVGVIDTGFWPEHPWLTGRVSCLTSLADDQEQAPPAGQDLGVQAGHGTHVCGVVAQVAPGASIVAARALDEDGLADDATVAAALQKMIATGVRLVNMSLGCFTDDDQPPDALGSVLESMPPSMALVAGAGNKDTTRPMFPAAFAGGGVFGVGALDAHGGRAYFSNWGTWVVGCARGTEVRSSFLEHGAFAGYAEWSGTSFAAPQFAGAVAARVSHTGESPRVAAHCLLAPGPIVAGMGTAFQPQLP